MDIPFFYGPFYVQERVRKAAAMRRALCAADRGKETFPCLIVCGGRLPGSLIIEKAGV